MTQENNTNNALMMAVFSSALKEEKPAKTEDPTLTHDEVVQNISECLKMGLSEFYPLSIRQKDALDLVGRMAKVIRKGPKGVASNGERKPVVNLDSDPVSPDALKALPSGRVFTNLSDDKIKEKIEAIYGAKPRGKFDAVKWRDKLNRDRKAQAV